jgi:hypothetical protein
LLASSALALGVLSIGGPFSADVEWLGEATSFSPIVLERPDARLPAVPPAENLSLAGLSLARPAAVWINPPTVAAVTLEDAGIQPVSVEAPEMALLDISPTDAGALTMVSRVPIESPAFAGDVEDTGIRLAALGSHEAALPDIPVTDVGALAAVSGIVIQPPYIRPLGRVMVEGFIAIELQPVEAGLAPVEGPAPVGQLCLGDCVAGQGFETCDKLGGAT